MTSSEAPERPSVLYVCVHNAGRSQMAAAYTRHLSGGAVEVRSAGSAPADAINPAVREAMLEEGIDLSAERPKILTTEAVQASDVVVTMGCGDTCPIFPGKRYEDWELADPAGQGVEAVRPIRDDIRQRVAAMLSELGVEHFSTQGPWVVSSRGFAVRALGRAGMEYVEGGETLRIDSESMATTAFVVYVDSIPAPRREVIQDDLTRAWRWAGYDVQLQG